jgi:hypothetical protein
VSRPRSRVNVHRHNFIDCFRYWENWRFGENGEQIQRTLLASESPRLQVAKAIKLNYVIGKWLGVCPQSASACWDKAPYLQEARANSPVPTFLVVEGNYIKN